MTDPRRPYPPAHSMCRGSLTGSQEAAQSPLNWLIPSAIKLNTVGIRLVRDKEETDWTTARNYPGSAGCPGCVSTTSDSR